MTSLTTAPADIDGRCSRVSKNDARVHGPCEPSIREAVVEGLTVINSGMNDGGGSGTGCSGIEVKAGTAKLTNVITA